MPAPRACAPCWKACWKNACSTSPPACTSHWNPARGGPSGSGWLPATGPGCATPVSYTHLSSDSLSTVNFSIGTRFFEVRGRLRLDQTTVEERSLLQRDGRLLRTLWRERGTVHGLDEALAAAPPR